MDWRNGDVDWTKGKCNCSRQWFRNWEMLDKFCMGNSCRGSGDLSAKAERPEKRHVCNSDWRCFQFAALEINHNHAQNCGQLKFRECLRTREIGIRISAADWSVQSCPKCKSLSTKNSPRGRILWQRLLELYEPNSLWKSFQTNWPQDRSLHGSLFKTRDLNNDNKIHIRNRDVCNTNW